MRERKVKIKPISQRKAGKFSKGQKTIPNFIVYRILGQPEVSLKKWSLRVNGLVENVLELTYNQLLAMPMKKIIRDFHCVTGWSVKNVTWEEIPLKHLAYKANMLPEAKLGLCLRS